MLHVPEMEGWIVLAMILCIRLRQVFGRASDRLKGLVRVTDGCVCGSVVAAFVRPVGGRQWKN